MKHFIFEVLLVYLHIILIEKQSLFTVLYKKIWTLKAEKNMPLKLWYHWLPYMMLQIETFFFKLLNVT